MATCLKRWYWRIRSSARCRKSLDMSRCPPDALRCLFACNAHGAYCVPLASSHRPAARRILSGGVWEAETLDLLRREAREGDVVHAGTYFGDFLPALSRAARPEHVVWAFEPSRENFRCAQITLLLNDISNVRLLNAALGDREGTEWLVTESDDGRALGGGSFLAGAGIEGKRGRPTERVRTVRIDDVVEPDRRISAIQLDVEGTEEAALAGAMETVRRWRPLLVLETLPGREWLESHLVALGYREVKQVDGNHVLKAG